MAQVDLPEIMVHIEPNLGIFIEKCDISAAKTLPFKVFVDALRNTIRHKGKDIKECVLDKAQKEMH